MNKILRHRGPDDEGFLFYSTKRDLSVSYSGDDTEDILKGRYRHISTAEYDDFDVILSQRRLTIIDLTDRGHCPMCDSSGRIWITYNGEVYNYIELRKELQSYGYNFYSDSDTEVIIYSYLKWGEDCLNHLNGMWAFAIWDARKDQLFLARDRFGVKPLYFSHNEKYFAFSSEMKPLIILDGNNPVINKRKIPFFLFYGNRLNDEDTYIESINSLRPSHYMIFKEGKIIDKQYYDIPLEKDQSSNERQLQIELLNILKDSIRLRFRSDVPVGTCLSGGFDSSSIVSLSSGMYPGSLNTFSAVWDDKECDESRYIDIVNKRYNCIENKIIPKIDVFEKVFDKLIFYQEIPSEGPGLYPQWFVMEKAKTKVKVLLDGQGGDEVFGGYFWVGSYLRSILKDRDYSKLLNEAGSYANFFHQKGVHIFSSWLFPGFYDKIVRHMLSRKHNILNKDIIKSFKKEDLYLDSDPIKKSRNYINDLSYHFIRNLTLPTLLHYEDRSSMAHSVESRIPFLDYRLVEFGLNLKPEFLVARNITRPLFRKTITDYLPQEITNRKDKLGYPTPFEKWTRSVLKPYVTDTILSENSLINSYVNKDLVRTNLKNHFIGKHDYSWNIWRLLSLEKYLYFLKNCKGLINASY